MYKQMINSKKKIIKNQNYEDYWKCTLALTDFYGPQFIRTLKLIVDHIDKYNLDKKEPNELMENYSIHKKRLKFNQDVSHAKELEKRIFEIYKNDTSDGATTRKQINTFIKLGFIKPYLNGYVPAAKEYIKPNKTKTELKRLFSDTVYQYSSFNSSQTRDCRDFNAIKFLVNTLINLPKPRKLESQDIEGIMLMSVNDKMYASKKELDQNREYSKYIDFSNRKYNQVSHLKQVLKNMEFLETNGSAKKFEVFLSKDANEYLIDHISTKRDMYRFGLMKKAVYLESQNIYNDKICWLTKKKRWA